MIMATLMPNTLAPNTVVQNAVAQNTLIGTKIINFKVVDNYKHVGFSITLDTGKQIKLYVPSIVTGEEHSYNFIIVRIRISDIYYDKTKKVSETRHTEPKYSELILYRPCHWQVWNDEEIKEITDIIVNSVITECKYDNWRHKSTDTKHHYDLKFKIRDKMNTDKKVMIYYSYPIVIYKSWIRHIVSPDIIGKTITDFQVIDNKRFLGIKIIIDNDKKIEFYIPSIITGAGSYEGLYPDIAVEIKTTSKTTNRDWHDNRLVLFRPLEHRETFITMEDKYAKEMKEVFVNSVIIECDKDWD